MLLRKENRTFSVVSKFYLILQSWRKWVIHYDKHIELNKSYQNESFDKFKLDKNEGNPYRDHCDGSSPEGAWKRCLAFSLKLSWKREKKLRFTTTMESTCNVGDTGDTGSVAGLGISPGGGNGNPLQYSCLKNPMDRGSWQATVQRVTKSWTWLSDWACMQLNNYH